MTMCTGGVEILAFWFQVPLSLPERYNRRSREKEGGVKKTIPHAPRGAVFPFVCIAAWQLICAVEEMFTCSKNLLCLKSISNPAQKCLVTVCRTKERHEDWTGSGAGSHCNTTSCHSSTTEYWVQWWYNVDLPAEYWVQWWYRFGIDLV